MTDDILWNPPEDLEPPDPDAAFEAKMDFQRKVQEEAVRLRIRDAAARLVRHEHTDPAHEPRFVSLTDFLTVPDDPQHYRIDRLWPTGGRIVLAAAYKAGKSTLRDNLVRSLVDSEQPFLGHFEVTIPARSVVLIDDELDERTLRRWLREQGVVNTDRVHVLALRGKASTFDLIDPDRRAIWAKKLRDLDADVVILDCLRPLMDVLGLDENHEAGKFLVAFEALLSDADVGEGLVVHHAGHNGERSRGDSRLRDWPDVEWKLVREADEDGNSDAAARRYFGAYGRDVDVPEGLLTYSAESRRLTYSGGTRRQTAADDAIPTLLDFVRDNEGLTQNAIEKAFKVSGLLGRNTVRLGLARAIELGQIDIAEGPNRARMHCLPAVVETPDEP